MSIRELVASTCVAAIAVILCTVAVPGADLPNAALTPGVVRSDMTVEQMCAMKWGKDHRAVTEAMKDQVYSAYGLAPSERHVTVAGRSVSRFEIDHLVSRELLGADDVKNLWPQEYLTKPYNAHLKDQLENRLHKMVCDGEMTLPEAQRLIRTDWVSAFDKYIGKP